MYKLFSIVTWGGFGLACSIIASNLASHAVVYAHDWICSCRLCFLTLICVILLRRLTKASSDTIHAICFSRINTFNKILFVFLTRLGHFFFQHPDLPSCNTSRETQEVTNHYGGNFFVGIAIIQAPERYLVHPDTPGGLYFFWLYEKSGVFSE